MVLATPGKWLRHKVTGEIFGYTDIMASNPAVEECTEEQAFPEKHVPKAQQGRQTALDFDGTAPKTTAIKRQERKRSKK